MLSSVQHTELGRWSSDSCAEIRAHLQCCRWLGIRRAIFRLLDDDLLQIRHGCGAGVEHTMIMRVSGIVVGYGAIRTACARVAYVT
jgi:hypothetical protein